MLRPRRFLHYAYTAAKANVIRAVQDVTRSGREDPLAGRDPDYIWATLPVYRRLIDLYFRPKIRGLEHIPRDGPVLLIGNHSGGTLIADTFAFRQLAAGGCKPPAAGCRRGTAMTRRPRKTLRTS